MITLSMVAYFLDRFAPSGLAAEWDNVGLLLGERDSEINRIMTCLTVTPTTAAEAIERGANLIITHHPVLFRGAKKLTSDSSDGQMILDLIKAGIAVYSPHTAFDNTKGGINELLANKLNLQDVAPLIPATGMKQVKLVVFVPESDLPKVSEAMFAVGAGKIGQYSECSYRLLGTGTFHGSEESNPTVGQKGRREEVSEYRLEVVCPEKAIPRIVAAMRQAHSYEEPAFDLYPLSPNPQATGTGRVGTLPQGVPLAKLAKKVRQVLKCGPVAYVGDGEKFARRVAIVCGAGGELLGEAIRAEVDVFLTGEMRYHDQLTAQARKLGVILPGHHATERCGVETLAEMLKKQWREVEVWASERECDPCSWA